MTGRGTRSPSPAWSVAIRVQWSPDPNAGLVVHDEDDDEARYVLVTGRAPTFEVRGWVTVGEARRLGRRIGEG